MIPGWLPIDSLITQQRPNVCWSTLLVHCITRYPSTLKAYVLPSLDYCCTVWYGCSRKDSQRLQRLVNYGCRIALHKDRRYSAFALYTCWPGTHHSRRRRHAAIHLVQMVYKCHSAAPPYLVSLFHTPKYHHNTQTRTLVSLRRTKTTFGQKAFRFVGVSMWRSLPTSVRDASSFHEFTSLARNLIF